MPIHDWTRVPAGGPRHPPSPVGPAESHTHATRTGSRPAIAGFLAADTAHSSRFATHGQQSGALGHVAGVCTRRLLRTARYRRPCFVTCRAGEENDAVRPQIRSSSASAAATGASERAAYLKKRDLRGHLALKPAP
jgi:hypothetical protein